MNRDGAYNQSLVTAFENQKQIHNQNYLDTIESNIKQAAKNGLTSTSVTFSILPGEGVAEMQIAQLEHCIKVLKEKGFECSPVHTTAYTYNSPRLLVVYVGWGDCDFGLFDKLSWWMSYCLMKIGIY